MIFFYIITYYITFLLFLFPADVDRFPSLDRSDSLPSSSAEGKRASTRLQDHNHSSETVFALPSMQIHLTTKHLQTATTPDFMGKYRKFDF